MSNMYAPPHPGKIIKEAMDELDLNVRGLAVALDVAPSTVQRLVSGKSAVSPEMAIRLEKVIGSTADTWLNLQCNYDLWNTRQHFDTEKLHPLFVPETLPA